MRFAGLVEYDGTDFSGWAAQPDRRTVEGTLADALATVLRQPVKLTAAGRTDAGVHASGQVASFEAETDLTPDLISYKTTAVLPEDVALRRCIQVSDDFDARRCARSRSYEYRITNAHVRSPLTRRYTTHVARELDVDMLQRTAELIRGTHNFKAFTPAKTYHVRFERVVKESLWEKRGELLVYCITADAFLYGMVRTLVGTMLEVAGGKRTIENFGRLLSGAGRDEAGPTTPGQGLTLVGVEYEGLDLKGGG